MKTVGNGVTNGTELTEGTDPNDPCDFVLENATVEPSTEWNDTDCDGDGVTNGTEVVNDTNPLDLCDFVVTSQTLEPSDEWNEADCDSDGVINELEVVGDTDGDNIFDVFDTDDDNDNIPTIEEDMNLDLDWFNDDCNFNGIVDYLDPIPCDLIPQGFSPNDDGVNDVLMIPGLSNYPDFILQIYNRYGNIVYDYKNAGKVDPDWWNAYSNGRWTMNKDSEKVPAGTYFIILDYNKGDKEPIQDWIYVNY